MGTNRHLDILLVIDEIAASDQEPVDVRHVCLACRIGLDAIGVAVYLIGAAQPLEVVGTAGHDMAELQVTMGEGLMRNYARNSDQLLSDIAEQVIARSPQVAELTRINKPLSHQ